MKILKGMSGFAAVALFAATGNAAGLDTPAYITQASGYAAEPLRMADILKPIQALAASLPHVDAGNTNSSLILQNGSYNNASVMQSGLGNVGLVAQIGYNNTAAIQQLGVGQQAFVLQRGTGNFASITQR